MDDEHLNSPMSGIYGSQSFPSPNVPHEQFHSTRYDHFSSALISPHYTPPYSQPNPHHASSLMLPPEQPHLRGRVVEQQPEINPGPLSSTSPVKAQRTHSSQTTKKQDATSLESRGSEDVHRIWSKQKNQSGESAYDILIQWVLVPGNYNRWRAKGSKKTEIAEEIHRIMEDKGIFGRNPSGVYQQLHTLELKYQAALEETKKTGGGLNGFSGEKSFSDVVDQIEAICPHFYELDAVIGDRPSATPLNHLESLSHLDTEACMEALGLPSSQASDNNTTSDVGDTNHPFEIPPPLNHSALLRAINQAEHPGTAKNPKRRRDSSVGRDELESSSSLGSSAKKARAPRVGSFLKSVGFDEKPDDFKNPRKQGSVAEELVKFQDTNSKQRERALDLQSEAIKGQISIGETIGGAMLDMTDVLKVIANPPKDKTTQELDNLRLNREKSDYEYWLAKQRAEILDIELERKAKLIERFEKSGKSFSEANQIADQMIEEQKKRMAD
ncbi:uncharacterized protein MELLADRAFT_87456 [Melampsora larici-populina 98AG31]|uniref:Uncharacterized protein n=1 Tax=Melampsora larici-populina (strain 98AG31 / pathotype 3-4-7) TaxID=747676 RepID=F4RND2_MELLP|nr:uncharacterized protein MELLADRAFT_87456 [Melampsora larici-populina 98AG31]EGG05969.1 hypothetical protein MELLADRAFT_87456 [Melampsora larici-populina 98AG31]